MFLYYAIKKNWLIIWNLEILQLIDMICYRTYVSLILSILTIEIIKRETGINIYVT